MSPPIRSRPSIAPKPSTPPPPKPSAPPAAPLSTGESKPGHLKTYVETKNPLLPRDGYLQVEHKNGVPTRILLANGKYATVKEVELSTPDRMKGYLVKAGGEEVMMVPLAHSGGGFAAFVPVRGAHELITKDGRGWGRIDESNLGHLFNLASQTVKRGDPPRTSPADLAAAKRARDQGAAAGVSKQVDALILQTAATKGKVTEATVKMANELKHLMPAIKDGTLTVSKDHDGQLKLEVTKKPGMDSLEVHKLEQKFGGRIKNLETAARKVEADLKRSAAMREGSAAELLQQVNSGPFIASLEKLPPAQRMAKMNQIASQLAGTAAGRQLAEELFTLDRSRVDPSMGHLTPRTELGKLLFKGVYDDPVAKQQLKGLAVNLAGHMPGDRYGVTQRMFEIGLGRALTPDELSASFRITNATPQELENPRVLDGKLGDVSSLLAALGDGAQEAFKVSKDPGLDGGARKLKAGAALVGTFQLGRSLVDMAKDPSLKGAVDITEDGTRAAGAWAKWVGGKGLEKVGDKLGIVSDAIGFAKDLHALGQAKSPEKRYDKAVSAYASGLILLGSIAASSTPWGIAAQVVGLGVKLLRSDSVSDAYDASHGRLEEATKTQAERDAEAAARKADYERRSTRERGNRI